MRAEKLAEWPGDFYDEHALTGIAGFAPVVTKEAKALILGSMPGVASLQKQQYYGHPRNAFWPIMAELFGAGAELDYFERKRMLLDNRIAVWDVLQSCRRQGSLDANIEPETMKLNDFAGFYGEYRQITRVFFNGAMAESIYKQRILPLVASRFDYLEYLRLPSTSPANATLSLKQKAEAWRVIKQHDMVK